MAGQPPPPGYPPPPGGGSGAPPPGGGHPSYDPYAAERALAEWAQGKAYTLNASPDINWYYGWAPFQFIPRFSRIGRELRATIGELTLFIAEIFDADPIKQAAGEDRQICVFVPSQALSQHAAIRSKSGGGIVNEVSVGLGSLLGGRSAGGVLGDPTFESKFEVNTPSREQGNAALTMPLRQMLLQTNWRGVLELRAGGMICLAYDYKNFDAPTLEPLLGLVQQIYQAATAR